MTKLLICTTLLFLVSLTNGQIANCRICTLDNKCLVPDERGDLNAKLNPNYVWRLTQFKRIQSIMDEKIFNLCGLNNKRIGTFTAEQYEGVDCEWTLSGMENRLFAIKNVQYKSYIAVIKGQEATELSGVPDQWKLQCH
uniref:Secreted salivary protein n=1 Tax=Culicoides nubeculosus TaxID=144565 RepID=B9URK9_CULNU|nr:secreted salivary protein [Culicoides nubeculosus]